MTSHQFFKSVGAKEVTYSQLPQGYGWVTGCGGGDGWYYNYFMKYEDLKARDYSKALMCKIQKI